jgi:hypothetical protein
MNGSIPARPTPILVPDGVCPVREITGLFLAASAAIDADIRDFVSARLREYGETKG